MQREANKVKPTWFVGTIELYRRIMDIEKTTDECGIKVLCKGNSHYAGALKPSKMHVVAVI